MVERKRTCAKVQSSNKHSSNEFKAKIPIKIKLWSIMFVRYHSLCGNKRVQGGKSIHFAIYKQIVRWKEEHQKENENKKEN